MSYFNTSLNIRQLFDEDTWTYTYLIWDERTKEAAIIDSVLEKKDRDLQLTKELGLSLKYAMETHVHADHITASGPIREATGCRIVLHKNSGVHCADDLAIDGDVFHLGDHPIHILHTPGHTDNDITYHIEGAIFTGDTMLVRDCGRTDFQLGSTEKMYASLNRLLQMPEKTLVLPAHDYKGFSVSTIGEEKRFNTRIGNNQPYAAFKDIMDNLNLPAPKRIQIAVPGNKRCGMADPQP